ncbi:glycosyl hydrolase family 28-related protein [Amycolatopsis ultiminotia]|uniref:glycosyl hydrolase family 28-related protein n=1 Tax=Amycolatopsis ultiminotia TaxID=543629 RepID=UPI0031E65F58
MSSFRVFTLFGKRSSALCAAATLVLSVLVTAGFAGAPAAAAAERGASVPFVEQEAEDAATNATVIGPDRTARTLAGEASGRKAVTLDGQGKYVEFTLSAAADSLDVRYSLPDNAEGTGIDGALSVYIDGKHARDLDLTSRYSWYYGSYPFTNDPAQGKGHHFYDETRALFDTSYPAGTKIRLQADAGDSSTATIDLADFEQVGPAAKQPEGSLSVTDFGATTGDTSDDAPAFDDAVAAAHRQGKEVWIPAGTFTLGHHITVDQVTLRGAGPWYSVLSGPRAGVFGKGEPASCGTSTYPGNPAVPGSSTGVTLSGFAIIGEVDARVDCDQSNAVGGALGGDSVVQNLWLQHTKVGLWLDGPFDGLTVRGNRILDQTADGLNLHQGISNALVTNNFLRNTGDDGLAMWSEKDADHDNTFSFNTVTLPILANNIAIYGGKDNTVSDNVVADNQDEGGGLHVANRFTAVPLAGTTTIARNTAIRTGVLDSNWQFGVGALWFDGRDSAITGRIDVTDNDLLDNNYEAIQFIDSATGDVHFDGLRITGAGTFAWQLQAKPGGSVKDVVATGIGRAGQYNCLGPDALDGLADQGGNSGWTSTYCGEWPDPVYPAAQTHPREIAGR